MARKIKELLIKASEKKTREELKIEMAIKRTEKLQADYHRLF